MFLKFRVLPLNFNNSYYFGCMYWLQLLLETFIDAQNFSFAKGYMYLCNGSKVTYMP